MNIKSIWLSIVAVVLSFLGGFMIANALNRNEIDKLQAENTRLQKISTNKPDDNKKLTLSKEDIDARIKEAEENPENFTFQKNLGLALYRYAGNEQDQELLTKVAPILERANKLNPDDYQVLVSVGNIYYDLGQLNNDPKANLKARNFYKNALEKNNKDANVRADFALTYLLTENPEREIAIKEFEKALEVDPNNERALAFITQAQIDSKNLEEANKYLSRLKQVNSSNKMIQELENSISLIK